ncbi:protein regulator of cytokinesis 1-like [Hylaeus anthracinus]|uniref:protein regulator of cytokinesis 1-like n=1 Tax=Hylaeus anthracinus TaxID=313031 RepID=UPI0023B9986D|nr:protein regulator of cytokinesis 1-like [Hylaeus anthracinus]
MDELSIWEPTLQKTMINLRSTLLLLYQIWEEIGFTKEACSMYCEQVFSHINDLLQEMVSEAQLRKKTILSNVTQLMDQTSAISKELGRVVQTTGYENYSLKDLEQVLSSDLQKLQYCKDQRMALLKELREKEQSLCRVLGTQPINLENNLPSEEELESFKLYLEKQEGEKNRLESVFKEMRRTIIKMINDLGISPSTNFEHFIYTDGENFVLNSNNMIKLKELRDDLKHQVDKVKKHVEDLTQELHAIWKNLDEPDHICQSFLSSYSGYSVATRNALQEELARCKEKRKQNIVKYVSQVRDQLVNLWDLCKFSEEQRKQFQYFHCQTYTEDLLTLHELEVKRVQKFYESYKHIFSLLEQRDNLWTKMKELLQRANDPDRFYNRGGQLLREEKERKRIQKQLPKMEEQLKNLIKEYEEINGEEFTINGMSIEEALKESYNHLNKKKETIKKTRKEAKDKSLKKVTLSASKRLTPNASKKALGVTSTCRWKPLGTSNRKLLYTQSPNTSAKHRNPGSGSKLRRNGRAARKILQSKKEITKREEDKENSMSQSSVDMDTTYNLFKKYLEDKRDLQSSVLSEQILINETISRMKTPVRTPAKSMRKKLSSKTTPTTSTLMESQLLKSSRSPRLVQSSKLATTSTPLPTIS